MVIEEGMNLRAMRLQKSQHQTLRRARRQMNPLLKHRADIVAMGSIDQAIEARTLEGNTRALRDGK